MQMNPSLVPSREDMTLAVRHLASCETHLFRSPRGRCGHWWALEVTLPVYEDEGDLKICIINIFTHTKYGRIKALYNANKDMLRILSHTAMRNRLGICEPWSAKDVGVIMSGIVAKGLVGDGI